MLWSCAVTLYTPTLLATKCQNDHIRGSHEVCDHHAVLAAMLRPMLQASEFMQWGCPKRPESLGYANIKTSGSIPHVLLPVAHATA